MARHARGSNQYRTRPGSELADSSTDDLMAQAKTKPQDAQTVLRELVDDPQWAGAWLDVLRDVLTEGDSATICDIVDSRHCPPPVIDVLVRSKPYYSELLLNAACNPGCLPQTLRYIYDRAQTLSSPGEDVPVMVAVLGNANCPPHLRERAARHQTSRVRFELSKMPGCPPDVLVQLLGDSVPEIRDRALQHPNLPEEYRRLRQVAQ